MTAPLPTVDLARPVVAGRLQRPPFALRTYYLVLVALLYLPIAVLFMFSVHDNTSLSFPLRGLTTEWYERLLGSDALLRSVRNSVLVAVGSSLVATLLGTMVALLALRFEFRTKRLLVGLAVLPLIVPFVVLAVALLILFRALDVDLSLVTVGVAHTIVALPYTLLIVAARLIGFERRLEEAAMDLGATYPQTLRLVVLPLIAPAMVSAWLTAFTVSFDEFALALFLAGNEPTFPVYLFGQLRFTTTLPVLIATAVLLMAASLALILVADRIRRIGLEEA
jgi:spermidine/putrescine transport system permease protein